MSENDGALINLVICDAILTKHLLQYRHAPTDKLRIVEPHAYGVMHDGTHAVWVWPVEAEGTAPSGPQALALVHLNEMRDVQMRTEIFEGHRPDYMRANRHMRLIHSQL